MATFTVRPEGIIRQPALTMPGNATGSEAACTSLTASQIRTLLSLGTTSDVTFDIVRATTSVLSGAYTTLASGGTFGYLSANGASNHLWLMANGSFGGGIVVRNITGSYESIVFGKQNDIKWTANSNNGYSATPDTGVSRTATSGIAEINLGTRVADGGTLGTLNVAAVDRPTAALTLGNSTYGVTVPGAAVVSGDISMAKTTQGYIRAYGTGGVNNIAMYDDNTNGILSTSSGNLGLSPASGASVTSFSGSGANLSYVSSRYAAVGFNSYHNGSNWIAGKTGYGHVVLQDDVLGNLEWYLMGSYSAGATQSPSRVGYVDNTGIFHWIKDVRSYGSSNSNYIGFSHDNTNGSLGTSSGNLNLVPAGGTVAVTGGITASGGATITGGGLASTYGVKIGSHSVGVGGIWSDSVTPSATNYNLLVDQTWTLINAPNVAGAIYFRHAGNSTATMTSTLFTCPPINTGSINCQGINVAYGGSGGTILTTTVPLILSSATSIIGLGGITSSFPAIKRSGTTFAVRLGDDSADAPISCAGITASGVVSHGAYTVATLPAAGSNAGKMAQVTDSNVAASGNYGATVAAGGANRVKVFSDGTNWVIA